MHALLYMYYCTISSSLSTHSGRVIWLVAAWQVMSATTVLKGWCKSGVLPETWIRQMRPDRAAPVTADAGESPQLRALITRMPVEPGVTREWQHFIG